MQQLLYILVFFGFCHIASAQQARPKSEPKKESVAPKKTSKNVSKAGKTNPTEKGSGMVIPKNDEPKLDARPNPAATVPSTNIPADNSVPAQP